MDSITETIMETILGKLLGTIITKHKQKQVDIDMVDGKRPYISVRRLVYLEPCMITQIGELSSTDSGVQTLTPSHLMN
jgi:hypothetical protein